MDINDSYNNQQPEQQSSGCTTCRKKIAQETFDMTVQGSSYLPIMPQTQPDYVNGNNISLQTEPQVKKDFITELYSGYIYPEPASIKDVLNKKDAIGELYSGNGNTLPFINTINQSKKMIPPYGPPIGDIYPDTGHVHDHDSLVPPYTLKKEPTPCDTKDCKLLFDNRNLRKELLFGIPLEQNCNYSLNLTMVDKLGKIKEKSVTISLASCCDNLIHETWCKGVSDLAVKFENTITEDEQKIIVLYSNFSACISDIITIAIQNEKVEDGFTWWPSISYQITDTIIKINKFVIEAQNRIVNDINLRISLMDFYHERSLSCICDGYKATYCCYPEDDPENCLCNGNPKNLCGESETKPVEFYFPYGFSIGFDDKYNVKGCGSGTIVNQSSTSKNKVFYSVQNKSNVSEYTSNEIDADQLPYFGNPQNSDWRKIVIQVPMCDKSKVSVFYKLDNCGKCGCPPGKDRVIEFTYDDFDYKEYLKWGDEKYQKCQMTFDKIYHVGPDDPESLKDCVNC